MKMALQMEGFQFSACSTYGEPTPCDCNKYDQPDKISARPFEKFSHDLGAFCQECFGMASVIAMSASASNFSQNNTDSGMNNPNGGMNSGLSDGPSGP